MATAAASTAADTASGRSTATSASTGRTGVSRQATANAGPVSTIWLMV